MLRAALRRVKSLAFSTAEAAGLNRLVGRWSHRRRRVLVLCYHGVSLDDEHEWNPELYVSPAHFRRRLEILRETGCTVLRLGDALERCASGTLPDRAVVLTFDDGTADFVLRALPLLREFGMPATVYLTTYYCGRRVPVPNVAVRYLLWRARACGEVDLSGVAPGVARVRVATAAERADAGAALAAALEPMRAEAKDAVVREVARRCGVDPDAFTRSRVLQIMSAEEARALPVELVDLELHTHRHRAPDDPVQFAREVADNRAAIEGMRPGSPRHFCYPSGEHRASMRAVLGAHGVRSATTCVPGFVTPTTDPLRAPRFVDTMAVSEADFRGWLSGLAALAPGQRHAP